MRIDDAAAADPAPKALLRHIRKHYGSVPAFCAATGLDRLRVQKAIRGKPKRMDVGFAFALQRATDGAVPAPLWVRKDAS